jgi:hypothetical protein
MSAQLVTSDLTRAEIDQLIAWNESGDPNNILKVYDYLASKGDAYADNAKEVVQEALTGVAPTSLMGAFFNSIVKIHWENAAGASAYATSFTTVAQNYQAQYLQLFLANEAYGFAWPTTLQIEAAYRAAVEKSGLPAVTAIDGVVSRLDLEFGDRCCKPKATASNSTAKSLPTCRSPSAYELRSPMHWELSRKSPPTGQHGTLPRLGSIPPSRHYWSQTPFTIGFSTIATVSGCKACSSCSIPHLMLPALN